MSKTSHDVKNAWNARNYDRITFVVPKGLKAHIQAVAVEKGYKSMGDYIKSLLQADSGLLLLPERDKPVVVADPCDDVEGLFCFHDEYGNLWSSDGELLAEVGTDADFDSHAVEVQNGDGYYDSDGHFVRYAVED